MKTKVVGAVLLVSFFAGSAAQAREGLSLGVDLGARAFTRDLRDSAGPGPAAGFAVAWGVTDCLDIRVRWDGSLHTGNELHRKDVRTSNWLMGPNLGLTHSFLSDGKVQPFVDAGVGAYWFGSGGGMMMNRDGYNRDEYGSLISWGVLAGAGVRYFVRDQISIGAKAYFQYIPFPNSYPGGPATLEGTNLSMLAMITYHFGGGKHCPMCSMMHGGHGEHGKPAGGGVGEKPPEKEEKASTH